MTNPVDRRIGSVRGVSRDVIALCSVIFIADVVTGIVSPTFSLYAESLGLPLAAIGLLNTIGGVSQLGFSIPLGILSDRIGRTRVLVAGMAAMMLAFGLAQGPWLLGIGRLISGAAMVATFQIGATFLGDISEPGRRSVVFGVYTTAMGAGFTVGPLMGGQLAEHVGLATTFYVGAAIAVVGILAAWRLLHEPAAVVSRRRALGEGPGRRFRKIAGRPNLLLVSFGNLLVSLTFSGAVVSFFPIHGANMHLAEATIGWMFAIRALASTLGRLPNGVITRALGSQTVIIGTLVIDAAVMFLIAGVRDPLLLTALLAAEGIAYGGFMVTGQSNVADRTESSFRGLAVGIYSTAGSIGGVLGPVFLGVIGQRAGIATVFSTTGAIMAVGAIAYLAGMGLLRVRPEGGPSAPVVRQ